MSALIVIAVIVIILLALAGIPAWWTALIFGIQHSHTLNDWAMTVLCAIVEPLGAIHGFGIWFGFWR